MSTIILACSSLLDYVRQAQKSQGTNYPVVFLNRKYHVDPKKMRRHIIKAIEQMPQEIDTVLVAMGYCGGSWEDVSFSKRVVIPRVDECVSLLLHTDDRYCPDMKEKGHLYMKDKDPGSFSLQKAFEGFTEGMDEKEKENTRRIWASCYTHVDIVDTGISDIHSEEYKRAAKENADWINGQVQYRKGSNHLIEKLVSGRWDEQFFVAEPGERINRELW